MAKPLRARPMSASKRPRPANTQLPRDVLEEVRRTARPADQQDAISRLSRAIELLERGDAGAAIREAEKAKRFASRSAAIREVLGLALYGEGRWQEALTELKTYRRISGRVDQNHVMADCLRGMGRPAEAVPLAEEELRSTATNEAKAEAVIVAASALADQKRFAEALTLWNSSATSWRVPAGRRRPPRSSTR